MSDRRMDRRGDVDSSRTAILVPIALLVLLLIVLLLALPNLVTKVFG